MPFFVHCLILAVAYHKSLTKAADLLQPCLYIVPSPSFCSPWWCNTDQNFFLPAILRHSLPYTEIDISSRDGEMPTFLPTHSCKIGVVGFTVSSACFSASPTPCCSVPASQAGRQGSPSLYSARGQQAPGRAAPWSYDSVVLLSSPQTVTHSRSLISARMT